jgi:vacuolar-type H+-ATPase subunit H
VPSENAETLARHAAERVREAIEAAETRAREIVARAEQEAARVRSHADAEARERVERAQEAVDRLLRQADELRNAVSSLGAEVAPGGDARSETPAPEIDPTPVTVPEPEPAREPEPTPPSTPEPEPPGEPEPEPPEIPEPTPPGGGRPSTEQLIEQLKGADAMPDEGAARLVAMKMAMDGSPRDEVARHLAAHYELAEPGALLDDVYSRVSK